MTGKRTTQGLVTEPMHRTGSGLLLWLIIACLMLVSLGLGARVTGMVAAGAAVRADIAAERDLAELRSGRALAEKKAQACWTAFGHDRAALMEMAASAGDLNSALRTVAASGTWPDAFALVGSATQHLEASKKSIGMANEANCTE